ncbi:MAG: aminotransferase class V-fold PLP-dependent enzyme, partial [Spirochaetales bacterium]|nr:aminotransferase class V-fold PLP-dependent enzyme [Spirochaetales bacterium]
MKRIFLDNAATSFPKAPGIADAVRTFLEEDCTNLNRTNSANEFGLFGKIYDLRSDLASMTGLGTPESVILNSGATLSLNMLIKGLFSRKDHVLVSSCEHNSVMRPLVQCGIPFSRIPCDNRGYIIADRIEE